MCANFFPPPSLQHTNANSNILKRIQNSVKQKLYAFFVILETFDDKNQLTIVNIQSHSCFT